MGGETRTGGPAFPSNELNGDGGVYAQHFGLTVRDYFAAKAMSAMCGGTWPDSNDQREIAKRAWSMADEMLKGRGA